MSTVYDSRAFVNKLKEAGMPERQADVLAGENLLLIAEHLATKDDLAHLATKDELAVISAKLSSLESEVKLLEYRLLLKLSAVMVTSVSLATSILGYLITQY